MAPLLTGLPAGVPSACKAENRRTAASVSASTPTAHVFAPDRHRHHPSNRSGSCPAAIYAAVRSTQHRCIESFESQLFGVQSGSRGRAVDRCPAHHRGSLQSWLGIHHEQSPGFELRASKWQQLVQYSVGWPSTGFRVYISHNGSRAGTGGLHNAHRSSTRGGRPRACPAVSVSRRSMLNPQRRWYSASAAALRVRTCTYSCSTPDPAANVFAASIMHAAMPCAEAQIALVHFIAGRFTGPDSRYSCNNLCACRCASLGGILTSALSHAAAACSEKDWSYVLVECKAHSTNLAARCDGDAHIGQVSPPRCSTLRRLPSDELLRRQARPCNKRPGSSQMTLVFSPAALVLLQKHAGSSSSRVWLVVSIGGCLHRDTGSGKALV